MVDYTREEIQRIINEIKEQLEDNRKIEDSYTKEMNNIEGCFNLKRQILNLQLSLASLLLVGSIFAVCSLNISNVALLVFIEIVTGISLVSIPIYISRKIGDINKKLKKKYNNFCLLSSKELSDQYEKLSYEKKKIFEENISLYDEMNHYEEKLEKYQSGLESSKIVQSYREEERKILDSYLMLLPIYENIDSITNIEDNIQYSENSKKLLKKM